MRNVVLLSRIAARIVGVKTCRLDVKITCLHDAKFAAATGRPVRAE
jgi:hypothetical protein